MEMNGSNLRSAANVDRNSKHKIRLEGLPNANRLKEDPIERGFMPVTLGGSNQPLRRWVDQLRVETG